jgi:hypothetical protein
VERPEERADFKHSDLLGHAQRERGVYLVAALTILRAYVAAGRPRVEAKHMGSYEAWCRVVRDALVWAGGVDPAGTQDALRESADVERDELRDLLHAWHEVVGDQAVTVRELLDAAKGTEAGRGGAGVRGRLAASKADAPSREALLDALRAIMPNGAEPTPHGVGNRLRTLRGQIVGGLVLKDGPKARGDRATYQVVRVA